MDRAYAPGLQFAFPLRYELLSKTQYATPCPISSLSRLLQKLQRDNQNTQLIIKYTTSKIRKS